MSTRATTDVFASTTTSFEEMVGDDLPNWAQDFAAEAFSPTGFSSATGYTFEKLIFNVNNRVRMDVTSANSGKRYSLVLTEHDDNNWHGYILGVGNDQDSAELDPERYIPVRVYFGRDNIMCVKYNSGRAPLV